MAHTRDATRRVFLNFTHRVLSVSTRAFADITLRLARHQQQLKTYRIFLSYAARHVTGIVRRAAGDE